MSPAVANAPSLNLVVTPNDEVVASGPDNSVEFREIPLFFAAALNTDYCTANEGE